MRRPRAELWLVLGAAALFAVAAIAGKASAPSAQENDLRLSTRLTGPNGARAFRTALGRFGVDVTERLRPFFDLNRGRTADPRVMLAVLQPAGALTMPEQRAARDWVARGGQLLLAGRTGTERCFAYAIEGADYAAPSSPWIRTEDRTDAEPVARAWVYRKHGDDPASSLTGPRRACEVLEPSRIERLWLSRGKPAAVRLSFPSGGSVVLVGDAWVFSNRALRRTDAGVLVLGWVLSGRPRAVVVDEYHQGFGQSGSLTGATLAWAASSPAGWMVLQLALASVLALALAAVRFGPAVPLIERRRRSPLEHLDALAAGLERSHAAATAIRLIVTGLRRRLSGGLVRTSPVDPDAWLAALEAGARTAQAKTAAHTLRRLARAAAGSADVQDAANAVEDVWETLKVPVPTRS